MAERMHAPRNSYRLQITSSFTLQDAAARIPALHALGVDWVYVSPILTAEPGSDHGYDVVSHAFVDPSRGGPDGLAALSAAAHRLGMGVLVDIVPNHVGVATPAANAWWWDVLARGRGSRFADHFDIDWDAGDGRVLIPIVGDDDVDGDRVIGLSVVDGELRYWENRLPIAEGTGEGTPDEVHARQSYRLVHWKAADDRLNYRRFFAVTTLAAIRVEEPAVFDDSHVEIRRWFDEGLVDGLRVDHPDGLRDPGGYLDRLSEISPFVLVEKILEPGEELPDWACAGTTGYDSLAAIDRLLTDPAGREPLDALDARLRGAATLDWHELIHDTKRGIADGLLRAEVLRLEREVRAAAEVPGDVADAIAELLACFPVYRSYLPAGREHLGAAADAARRHRPDLVDTIDRLLVVLGNERNDAALRFQQTSGMVMAKGVEDTAFYRFTRLTSLTEVGGDPSVFSSTGLDFHTAMASRQQRWPQTMNALSTHDTKRGEDVRARISTFAEVPDAWAEVVEALMPHAPIETPEMSHLLLQAIVGAWPASRERLHAYALKAAREADDATHWTAPNHEFEHGLLRLVDATLDDADARALIGRFVARVRGGWLSNSLSAKLLSLTIPGFGDVYQGSELFEQSLVDPDNRRPVDADRIAALADRIAGGETPAPDDGEAAKLHVTATALRLRRDEPQRFERYDPLLPAGERGEHAIAFDRGGAITVATRLPIGLADAGGWGDTTITLPDGDWVDALTTRAAGSGRVRLADMLDAHPVALLVDRALRQA